MRQWMESDDVSVQFDHLEILKKDADLAPVSLAEYHGGRMSWPIFMHTLTGLMHYSVLEAGLDEPIITAADLERLASYLESQGEHGFILRSENMVITYKVLEHMRDTTSQVMEAQAGMAKSWGDMMDPLGLMKPQREAADMLWRCAIQNSERKKTVEHRIA